MAVYTRPNSSFYWMRLERPNGASLRESTRVKVDAPTAVQRRDNRQLAETVYHTRMARLAQELHALPTARRRASGPRQADCNLSSFRRARVTFARISAALAVQMYGLGC